MSDFLGQYAYDLNTIVQNLVTEDDEPVENIYSEKQARLATEPLYSSWQPQKTEDAPEEKRKFLAAANVGIFFSVHRPPLVPDMFLSMDVEVHEDWYAKEHRSYFVWEFDKVPEVVVEVVSNKVGGELDYKLKEYAKWGITYYVVFDPLQYLSKDVLRVYEIGFGKRYRLREDFAMPEVSLSLTLWDGEFEGKSAIWLRWCDADGNIIPTGAERAKEAEAKTKEAEARADAESKARKSAEAELEELRTELQRLKKKAKK
jgi:Uma2 family endonuclease